MYDPHDTPGHWSDIKKVNQGEVQRLKAHIGPNDVFIIIYRSRVIWAAFVRYLCEGKPPLENRPFFEPVDTTILSIRRNMVLLPHAGWLNYIGHVDWVIESNINTIPPLLRTESLHLQKLAKAGREAPIDIVDEVIKQCKQKPVYQQLIKDLKGPGLRVLWDGHAAMVVRRMRDRGVTWPLMYKMVVEELGGTVIDSLRVPTLTPTAWTQRTSSVFWPKRRTDLVEMLSG
jgi:hypothetical protein